MANYKDIQLLSGGWMRVHTLAAGTFRIQMNETGQFTEPTLIRYGFLQIPDLEHDDSTHGAASSSESAIVNAGYAELRIDLTNGQFSLLHANGKVYVRTWVPPWSSVFTGFGVRFSIQDDEAFYGLGSILPEHMQRRGLKADIWVGQTLWDNAPIPFLMSSNGWAILMNTTWRHSFDVCSAIPDQLSIEGAQGELDFFLFAGDSFGDLLNLYTNIAGKPQMLPIWMYGLNFCSRQASDAREVLEDAIKFRRSGTPCDLIGLTKDFTEKVNDSSLSKQWHPEKFPTSTDPLLRQVSFIGILQKQGFKLSLKLECDYDLTIEEERMANGCAVKNNRSDERWYTHLEKFVDDGISAFVLGVKKPGHASPDRLWANGMNSDELHNLFAMILGKQMHQGFRNQTGMRPSIHIENGYVGMQRYIATTSGSYYKAPQSIAAVLNYGLSGHVNTSTNMHTNTREGIHSDLLLTWSRVYSQSHFVHPDFLEQPLHELFQTYAKLRYRLLPYIYSTAHVAARTGMPITRAMPLMFPDDSHCRELSQQFMLGDFLLVVVYTNHVYLPEGVWIDYWTGERYNGLTSFECAIPAKAGGLLFVRAGAILPMWPKMDYIGQIEAQALTLHVYPHQQSAFTLYEDDGTSFQYLEGFVAQTHFSCEADQERTFIQITRRSGIYANMPARRYFELIIHMDSKPAMIKVNDERRPDHSRRVKTDLFRGWRYDRLAGTIQFHVDEALTDNDAVRVEILHPVNAKSNGSTRAQTVASPPRKEADEVISEEDALQAALEAALHTGELLKVETALTTWWSAKMEAAESNETWLLQMMNICHLIVRHAENNGWATSEVFAGKMDLFSLLKEIDSPQQGYQFAQRLISQLVEYAQMNRKIGRHPAVREIITMIEQELDRDLSLNKLAERVSLHPFHLSRLFKQETNQTFTDYVMAKRMIHAKKLLESGLKVYEAAALNGFKDTGNFSNAFSKYWGVPPTHFKSNRQVDR